MQFVFAIFGKFAIITTNDNYYCLKTSIIHTTCINSNQLSFSKRANALCSLKVLVLAKRLGKKPVTRQQKENRHDYDHRSLF